MQLVVVVATRPGDDTTTATVRPAGASPAGIATTAPEHIHAAGLIYDYNRAGFWTGSRPRALAGTTHVGRLARWPRRSGDRCEPRRWPRDRARAAGGRSHRLRQQPFDGQRESRQRHRARQVRSHRRRGCRPAVPTDRRRSRADRHPGEQRLRRLRADGGGRPLHPPACPSRPKDTCPSMPQVSRSAKSRSSP